MKKLSRKQFIQIVALGGGAAAALKFGMDKLSQFEQVTETRLLMGTVVNLTIIADNKTNAQAGLTAALDKMEALENVLSQYKPASQLSMLNSSGKVNIPDKALVDVLTEAARIAELSGGAFDISIKPVLDLYKQAAGVVDAKSLTTAMAGVDQSLISISSNEISLADGMAITVDGIAKGYIVDQAVSVLNSFGLENVMVEAGGDLLTSGLKAGEAWKIGVQSPRGELSQLLASFEVNNQAVATSGDYLQAFSDDFSLHHIIDPRTGRSSTELASATVVADSTMLADALATTMMVMGPQKGLALVNSMADVEAFLIGKDLQEYRSEGFAV